VGEVNFGKLDDKKKGKGKTQTQQRGSYLIEKQGDPKKEHLRLAYKGSQFLVGLRLMMMLCMCESRRANVCFATARFVNVITE